MHPPPGHVCFVGRVGLQTGQSADRDGDNSASAASSKIRNRMHPSSGRGRFVGLVCFHTGRACCPRRRQQHLGFASDNDVVENYKSNASRSSGRVCFLDRVCDHTGRTADRDGGSSFSASPPGMASSIFINRMHRGPRVACVSSAVCAIAPVGLADRGGGSSISASSPIMASSKIINRMLRGPRDACASSAGCAFAPVRLLTATAAAAFQLRLREWRRR